MRFHVSSLLVTIVFRIIYADYPPLTVIADSEENTYELTDLDILEKKSLMKQTSIIIQCCQSRLWISQSDFIQACRVDKEFYYMDPKEVKCSEDIKPTVVLDKKIKTSYEIGYTMFEWEAYQLYKATVRITVLVVNFDFEQLAVINSQSEIERKRHSYGKPITCVDYTIGPVFFPHTFIDRLYEQDNQDEIIRKLILPITATTSLAQLSRYPYLVKHLLTPIDDYNVESVRKSLCTYLNVTPIWQTISTGSILQVERYIRNIVDHEHIQEVQVVTGVYEKLKLLFENETVEREIYLDKSNGKIPIFRILYKIIVRRTPLYEQYGVDHLIMIVVVHNELRELTEDQLLCKSVCRQTGWNVENNDFLSGRTYCCDPTDDLMQRLQVKGKWTNIKTFNLLEFPIYEDGQWKTVNIVETSTLPQPGNTPDE